MKQRIIVLTDIFYGFEVDDIQSMIRLLCYANDVDIEGLIACSSCFVKKGGKQENADIIHRLIDAYGRCYKNLSIHADGYPQPSYLHSVTCCGIPQFGRRAGNGFAHKRYNGIEGVKRIIDAADSADERPLWICLWGGANTLAQAVWLVRETRSEQQFDTFIRKLRVYGISDQDFSGKWLRDNFGDRLYYIVSPSKGSWFGNWTYYKATWPGISSDNFNHGSEDGKVKSKGFTGGDFSLIDNEWIEKNVRSVGALGALYPLPTFLTEGDTPTYLGLLPNGLNVPGRPDYGGWGGRYNFYRPDRKMFGTVEKFPIWTNVSDTVIGADGKIHTSPQSTIWRWRKHFQNEFAARMQWTVKDRYEDASHPPVLNSLEPETIHVKQGEKVLLRVYARDSDGCGLSYAWIAYDEVGGSSAERISFDRNCKTNTLEVAVKTSVSSVHSTVNIIAQVATKKVPQIVRYKRFILKIN